MNMGFVVLLLSLVGMISSSSLVYRPEMYHENVHSESQRLLAQVEMAFSAELAALRPVLKHAALMLEVGRNQARLFSN